MCDAFLILAQTASGLSCLFLPARACRRPLNAIRIQRLKDKLGNKANASSEVEFHGASAWLVGEEGRGIPQILEMGTMTRLDCALGTSGLMRQALSIALNHASAAPGVWQAPDRPTPDAQCAGRFGAGI
jgi:putative acyl-CoA dehydrogenase